MFYNFTNKTKKTVMAYTIHTRTIRSQELEMIKNASITENIEMLEHLLDYSITSKKFVYKNNPYNYACVIQALYLCKNHDILNKVIDSKYKYLKINDLKMLKILSNILFSNDKTEIVQFLYDMIISKQKSKQKEPNMVCILFMSACNYLNFEFAKTLYTNYTTTSDPNINTHDAINTLLCENSYDIFYSIGSSGNVLFGKWLISTIPAIKSNKEHIYRGFKIAIFNSFEIDTAIWFHSLFDGCDFENFITQNNCTDYNYLFQLMCKECLIDHAKWLHSLKKSEWNVNYTQAFISTCLGFLNKSYKNENYDNYKKIIEICTWLLELDRNIDVCVLEHFIFKKYINELKYINYFENKEKIQIIMDWLISLRPYDYYLDKKTNMYKIRSKKDAKWEERRLYHYLALQHYCHVYNSNKEPQHILTRLPYQVCAYIISFI